MSVINQVLNQLEQRGAHTAPEQTMVRPVPHGKRSFVMPVLALGLALAGGLAAWQWIQLRKPVPSLVEGPKVVAVSAIQLQPTVVAIPALAPIVPADAAIAANAGEVPPSEMLPPASRLSFELSSIPLPSALEHTKNVAPPAQSAMPQPTRAVPQNGRATVPPADSISPMKKISPAQQVDAEFRKAVALMQQGHIADAIAGYEAVLRLDARHDAARQALVALLLEGKRGAEAERALQGGLKIKPEHTGFAMLLARLQVERGTVGQAMATLEKTLPYADRQADYQAFFAALLQRQNRHKEAITHYEIALQLAPDNGIWLMGYGISLQAVQRTDDARDAFGHALESKTLNPELQAFVQSKIKGL